MPCTTKYTRSVVSKLFGPGNVIFRGIACGATYLKSKIYHLKFIQNNRQTISKVQACFWRHPIRPVWIKAIFQISCRVTSKLLLHHADVDDTRIDWNVLCNKSVLDGRFNTLRWLFSDTCWKWKRKLATSNDILDIFFCSCRPSTDSIFFLYARGAQPFFGQGPGYILEKKPKATNMT